MQRKLRLQALVLATFIMLFGTTFVFAQTSDDRMGIERAAFNYLEGFYEGDSTKIAESLSPNLNKFGFWKSEGSSEYGDAIHMSFEQAKSYAARVLESKEFPDGDAPKNVEILDVMNHIASVKVTAWWGVDYMLLSKSEGKWMIEHVIWEGPLDN